MTDIDIKQLTVEIADEIAYDVSAPGGGQVDGIYDAANDIIILLYRRGILKGQP